MAVANRKLRLVSDEDAAPKRLAGRGQFTQERQEDEHGWTTAIDDFIAHKSARLASKSVQWYRERLAKARQWMAYEGRNGAGVPLADLRARDVDRYLDARRGDLNGATGETIKDSTRRADAVAIKAFVKWARREGLIEHNPLADYEVPRADKPFIPTPKKADIRRLLTACQDRWSPSANPAARFMPPAARTFHRRRNYAILTGLVGSALRIGEMLALALDDIDFDRRVVLVRKAKSNKPREVPFEAGWVEPLRAWLKVRPECDSNLVFITEYGTPIGYKLYLHSYRRDLEFAGIEHLTLHQLRHYATDAVAAGSIKAASERAGHANIATTQAYLHGNIEHVRKVVDEMSPLGEVLAVPSPTGGKIMRNTRTKKKLL